MRGILIAGVLVTGCATSGSDDQPVPTYSDGKADGSTAPACSLQYWDWLLHTYEPMLDKPASDVSAQDLANAAAQHPDMGETPYTEELCWQPLFDKYVFAPAAKRVHDANVAFITDPSLQHYLAYIATPADLQRNSDALDAILPKANVAGPSGLDTWGGAYWPVLGDVIHPVGVPGLMEYDNIVEDAWVIDAPESQLLTLLEAGRPESAQDGGYYEWVGNFGKWLFGNPPDAGNWFVFDAPWEPGYNTSSNYGSSGIVTDTSGNVVMPDSVRAFVDRLEMTKPKAIGPQDSMGWMILYHARMLRAEGWRDQPIVVQTDDMALDVLEEVKPANLQGVEAYGDWLDLYQVADLYRDRLANTKPCIMPADMDAATQKFTASGQPADAAPSACAGP